MMEPRRAFTLVELLVVVAILAVLAGLLTPAFVRAKRASLRTADLCNLREIGLALRLYLDDSDDESPLMWMPAINQNLSWVDSLQPYARARLLCRSPLDDSPAWSFAVNPRRTSYAMNGWFDRLHFAAYHPDQTAATPAGAADPAGCAFVMPLAVRREGTDFLVTGDHFMPQYWGSPPTLANAQYQAMQWNPATRRPRTVVIDQGSGKTNVLFLDGHAQARAIGSLFTQSPGSRPSVDRFNPWRAEDPAL